MNVKAIIWDLDGVIIDSEKDHVNVEIATLKEYGINMTREIASEYLGYSLENYMRAIAERFKPDLPVDEVLAKHGALLEKYYGERFPAVPHVEEVVAKLSKKYVLGLATSAVRSCGEGALKRLEIFDYFTACTYGDEVEYSKPNPEIFLKTAEKLDVDPAEVVVIEDAESGFYAAKDAGMRVIARRGGHNAGQDFGLADVVVEDLLDVEECLKKF